LVPTKPELPGIAQSAPKCAPLPIDCATRSEGTPLEQDGAQQLGEVESAAMGELHLFFVLDDIHAGRA
jgi:hypothetical protein